ncbi:MAG: Methanol dehydrogenase activator [candidate division WS2 bacterium]|nr:Methanol dehydrogenase activator [Candidatus Lithacetigena glycinireducens]
MKIIYKGRFLQVVEKEGHEIVNLHSAVAIIPECEDNVLLIKHYRPSIGKSLLELPAGWVEEGESLEKAALRELKEETGFISQELEFLVSFFPSPGYTSESLSVFIARNLKNVGETNEIEELVFTPKNQIKNLIKNKSIIDGKTLIGLMYYLDYRI